jgi:cytochrome c oxidase assembly protein subunit 15
MKKKSLKLLTIFKTLSLLIFFLIVLGGTVRNLGAGLSCPDWPLCFGKLLPHFDLQIFSEFFHRLIAGTVSIGFVGAGIYICLKKNLRKLLGTLLLLGFILLATQVVLGGLTVLKLLQSDIVTLHLATGTLFFAVVMIITLRLNRFGSRVSAEAIRGDRKRTEPSNIWRMAIVALIALYIQIVFGGIVSSHHAGLACSNNFPKCLGVWWPETGFDGITGIHLVHRFWAFVTFLAISAFVVSVEKNKSLPRPIVWKARFAFGFLLLQIILGIGNVLYSLPIPMDVAHLAVAEVLFALILIDTYEIRHYELH